MLSGGTRLCWHLSGVNDRIAFPPPPCSPKVNTPVYRDVSSQRITRVGCQRLVTWHCVQDGRVMWCTVVGHELGRPRWGDTLRRRACAFLFALGATSIDWSKYSTLFQSFPRCILRRNARLYSNSLDTNSGTHFFGKKTRARTHAPRTYSDRRAPKQREINTIYQAGHRPAAQSHTAPSLHQPQSTQLYPPSRFPPTWSTELPPPHTQLPLCSFLPPARPPARCT